MMITPPKNAWKSIAISSASIMCFWILLGRFGMFMFILMLSPLVLFSFIMWVVSLIQTIISLFITGFRANKIKIIFHSLPFIIVALMILLSSENFRAKTIIKANYKEDSYSYYLTFREDNTCETYIIGFAGFEQTIEGTYQLKGDTIIFETKPYNNDFIADTMIIDYEKNRIYNYRHSISENDEYRKDYGSYKIMKLKK